MSASLEKYAAAIEPWTAADHALSSTTRQWLSEAVPPNTRRAYDWAWSRFVDWCGSTGRCPLPAAPETVAEHMAALRSGLAAPATLDQALGVIGAMHRKAGAQKPDTEQARALVRGYRRSLAEQGVGPRQAPPLTRDVLRQVVDALDLSTVLGRRDRLMLVLGFQMMARRSELAALRCADVVETDRGVDVMVRTSKTDKESRGRAVALPAQKDAAFDLVRLVRAWRSVDPDEPLLCRLDLGGRPAGPISGHGVNHALRAAVRRAGVAEPERYTAHSLRAGGLTDALLRGVPVSIAARHGGWNPESPTVLSYARAADRWRDNAMQGAFT